MGVPLFDLLISENWKDPLIYRIRLKRNAWNADRLILPVSTTLTSRSLFCFFLFKPPVRNCSAAISDANFVCC